MNKKQLRDTAIAKTAEEAARLRQEIADLVGRYCQVAFGPRPFVPGESKVPVSGRVFDVDDVRMLVDSALDFWLTSGRFADQFEKSFSQFLGVKHAVLCNSGSSANLLAISALTSDKLQERALKPGDEVITVAAGFPTTVNPIIQNRLVPVFLDVDLQTYNVEINFIEEAITERTRAIMIAHTLGNPFRIDVISEVARKYELWLIEDNCDALGSTFNEQLTGTFGDLATASFYPAHHITMGEGGCVVTNDSRLKVYLESFRDWGRDCWCDPGKDNTCGKRFDWQLGGLPYGYDHKYIYSHIGYNLKATDMQAAVGVAQLAKLPEFIKARKANFRYLYEGLKEFQEYLILPEATAGSDPSWFGFPITVKSKAPFTRAHLINFLESKGVATRQIFAGNLTMQPAYRNIPHRVIGELSNTNIIMNQSFWIGVYPALTPLMLDYVTETIRGYIKKGCFSS